MKTRLVGAIAAAFAAAGCAQQPPAGTSADPGLVDPATGKIQAQYLDSTYSLAPLYEERLNRALRNSDRRAMDNALDAAFATVPGAPETRWSSPATGHAGSAQLSSWDVDGRTGETCGTFLHGATFGGAGALNGVAIFCRAESDAVWFLDEASWRDAPARRYGRGSDAGARRPADPDPRPPANPGPVVRPGDGAGTPPGAGSPSGQFGNARQRAPGEQPPPCPDSPGGGAVTLGDCLAPSS